MLRDGGIKVELQLSVKVLREDARLPCYGTAGAAGLDLYFCALEPTTIPVGTVTRIPTGVAVAVPPGYVGLIRDRSSLAMAGLQTVAGVIDSDYRGEVMVAVHNTGISSLTLRPGDRIAQMLILPCPQLKVVESTELPGTERGAGGFGSTGR
jgi:dUTP pyrophosphatase